MKKHQDKTYISSCWLRKGAGQRVCVIGTGQGHMERRLMEDGNVVSVLPLLTKPRATLFTFPGLCFHNCMRTGLPSCRILRNVLQRVINSEVRLEGGNIMDAYHGRAWPKSTAVLAPACWGPVLSTSHASRHLIILWGRGGGPHHHQQFANEEMRAQKRIRVFPKTLGLAVVELGFDPEESGFWAWELSPSPTPLPRTSHPLSVCAAKA